MCRLKPYVRSILWAIFYTLCVNASCYSSQAATRWRGVNIAGAEFAADRLPGRINFDYHYPTREELTDAARAGANIIRLPFLWERLQPTLGGPFDQVELSAIDATVNTARTLKLAVLLDPHNYGAYRGELIGSAKVPTKIFVQFWRQLAVHFVGKDDVLFGLMNEPNMQTPVAWAAIAQAAITAIREEGASQWILVPGTSWTGAHSWTKKRDGYSNAEALRDLRDPLSRTAFDMHQYFDDDSSGTQPACVRPEIAAERLKQAEAWLSETGLKAFLGEFGASADAICLETLSRFITHLESSDVWIGWTYWASAAWFGDYMFNAYPNELRPQGEVLKRFFRITPR